MPGMLDVYKSDPLMVVVVHDCECEIDKPCMRGSLEAAFEKIGPGPVLVGSIDIFIVLVRKGKDEFVDCGECTTFDYDEKPSERIAKVGLQIIGAAHNAKSALKWLKADGFFDKCD